MEGKSKAALFIDGQNMGQFNVEGLNNSLKDYDLLIKRAYLAVRDIEYHKERGRDIVGFLQNSGFEVRLSGHLDNVDPYIITEITEVICKRSDIEKIILASGDGDFLPVVYQAKSEGKETILLTKENQEKISAALKNSVNKHIEIPS